MSPPPHPHALTEVTLLKMPSSATLIIVDFRPELELFMPYVTATLRSAATCLAYRRRRRRHLPHLPAAPTPPATSVSTIFPLRSPARFRRRPICSIPPPPSPLPPVPCSLSFHYSLSLYLPRPSTLSLLRSSASPLLLPLLPPSFSLCPCFSPSPCQQPRTTGSGVKGPARKGEELGVRVRQGRSRGRSGKGEEVELGGRR